MEIDNLNIGILDNLIEGFQFISYDWKYLYLNDTAVKQSKNTSKHTLLGQTMMQCFLGIEKTEMFKVLEACMKDRVSKTIENEFTFPDNSKGWFELRIEPVEGGIFILSIDISERKRAELARKEYTKNLEELLFMTSHKVRQPIANIIGISTLLSNNNVSIDELTKIADFMKQSAQTLEKFTEELTSKMNNYRSESST